MKYYAALKNHAAENDLRMWVNNVHDIVSGGKKQTWAEEYIYVNTWTLRDIDIQESFQRNPFTIYIYMYICVCIYMYRHI